MANAADYEKTYKAIDNIDDGISSYFEEPFKLLYDIVAADYYNYKYVETTYGTFTKTSMEDIADYFFNIVKDSTGNKVKADDVGTVAFIPQTLSANATMAKVKDDYHSAIEYEFILSPVAEDGGYAYLSPSVSIAVNKNSSHLDWVLEFMDFLFEEKNNITYSEAANCIPNTSSAESILLEKFNVPSNHISQLGEVTFSWNFYDVINATLVNISKANAQKYMKQDENGNYVMYDFDYYMDKFEADLATYKAAK